jgi:hypothetical protein
MTPNMSIVKGSHFVFAKPLLFRRYIEAAYLEPKLPSMTTYPVITAQGFSLPDTIINGQPIKTD